jgi:hypothetical protein
MDVRDYWQQSPTTQKTLLDVLEEQRKAEIVENSHVIGYTITIEAPDTTMPTTEQDRDIVICAECFEDLQYCSDMYQWEPVTNDVKANCEECNKELR